MRSMRSTSIGLMCFVVLGCTSSATSPDSGPRPSNCTSPPPLPADAPALTPGVITALAIPDVAWGPNVFTQGMALDPCDPATIYVGVCAFNPEAARAGIYKTTNGGSTWRRVGHLDEPVRIRIDPRNRQHLYSGNGVRGATMGFWVSNDGGESWTQPDAFVALSSKFNYAFDVYDVAPDPEDFDHVLVTFHSPWEREWGGDSGVVESFDGGTTWTVHPPKSGFSHGNNVWFIHSPSTWLLGTQNGGFFRTENSGATWDRVSTVQMAHGGGQLYHAPNGNLYASGTPYCIRSTDDGRSWNTIGQFANFTSIYGDGTHLYASPGEQFWSARIDDDENWAPYGDGTGATGSPFEMAFDAINGILYASSWGAGMLALRVVP